MEKKVNHWLVFGDDWGRHPSTTQYLIRHLPPEKHLITWINSIGMRAPRLTLHDLKRASSKLLRQQKTPAQTSTVITPKNIRVIEPRLIPWHLNPFAQRKNKKYLWKKYAQNTAPFDVALLANPVGTFYMPERLSRIGYLRLDDYQQLPGTDPDLVTLAEKKLLEQADIVVAPAKNLLFPSFSGHSLYLPQGVDTTHFSKVTEHPPKEPVLGFFGLLAEWLDYALMETVAKGLPEWTFEFIGPIRFVPEPFLALQNVRYIPAKPYETLPNYMQTWSAAWAPFKLDSLTQHVNPLKVREYLAAGLPTFCTPLPEVQSLQHVNDITAADPMIHALKNLNDSPEDRQKRKASVAGDSWQQRATVLAEAFGVTD